LLQRRADSTIFMARWGMRSACLSSSAISEFVESVSDRWEHGEDTMSQPETARLETFLHLPAGTLTCAVRGAIARPSRSRLLPLLPAALGQHYVLRKKIRGMGVDAVYLNVSHGGLDTPSETPHWTAARKLKPVFLVHDLIPLSHAEYARPGEADRHRRRMRTVVKSAAAVIANSHHTKDVLADFAAQHDASHLPIIVSPLGVETKFHGDPTAEVLAAARHGGQPGSPYFLMIGTIEPRKNHLLILGLWRQLAEEMGERTPKLIIVGRRGWENENVIDMIERCRGLQPHVLECNRMSDRNLKRLMLGARAVLFPSFAEGYGLPLVESLSLRVPAICSDLAVFREVAGNIPEYIAPIDGIGWMRMIQQYASPISAARQSQVMRLSGFAVPTWDAHFDVVEEVLERARCGSIAEWGPARPVDAAARRDSKLIWTAETAARSNRRRAI
jgi:glycosyltransferase involved in cell wall biosynthesis